MPKTKKTGIKTAPERFRAGLLESFVINYVDQIAQNEKDGNKDQSHQYRIKSIGGVENVTDERAQDNEGRVGDIDDIEEPKG